MVPKINGQDSPKLGFVGVFIIKSHMVIIIVI